MVFIVFGIAVIALLALVVAIVFGSIVSGWIAIWVSAVGLVLLLVDGLRHYEREVAQQDVEIAPSPRLDVTPPDNEAPSTAPEPTDDVVQLHPDIWPPEHAMHEAPGDDSRLEPRRAREGESLHPDIWP